MEGNDTNKQIGGKVRSTWDTFNSSEIYAIYSSSLFFNPDHLNCLYMYSSSVERYLVSMGLATGARTKE